MYHGTQPKELKFSIVLYPHLSHVTLISQVKGIDIKSKKKSKKVKIMSH